MLFLLFPLAGSKFKTLWLGLGAGSKVCQLGGTGARFWPQQSWLFTHCSNLRAPRSSRAQPRATLWQRLDLGKGNLPVGADITIDQLSIIMLLVITGVGFLIHWYSVDTWNMTRVSLGSSAI